MPPILLLRGLAELHIKELLHEIGITEAQDTKKAKLWPETWHLAALADYKMRLDGFGIRRHTFAAITIGQTPPPLRDADKPW